MTHTVQKIVLGLVAVGAVVLWLRSHDAAVKAQALAEARADSLHVATVRQDSLDAVRARDSAAVADSIGKLRARTATLAARAGVLSRRADSLVALDSLKPALALKDSVIAAQSTEIVNLEKVTVLEQQRWAAADSSAVAWKALALAGQSQLAASLKRSAPRFACVGGVGITAGLGGSAAGLGVTCGVRL